MAQLAKIAGGRHLRDLTVAIVPAHVVSDAKSHTGVAARFDHGLAFFYRRRHRLFHEHVLAGRGGGDGVLGM